MNLSKLIKQKVIVTPKEKEKTIIINSQKANGVFFLEKAINSLEDLNIIPNKHWLFNAGTLFEENDFIWPVFARPCPIVPRHGFVDSVVCNSASELNEVSKKTFEVEPEGEILIATPINCKISGIICGNSITYGPNNDGATSGKACGHFYISEDIISKKINLDSQLIHEGEVPFYEVVFNPADTEKTILVQARSAPGTNGFKDYIPKEITIKNIIKAEGDLLEWEDLLKKVDNTNTIIDHVGGSLASHYAIHALINKVSIFTTYLPEIGQTIQPIAIDETYTEKDKNTFIEAFQNGFNSPKHIFQTNNSFQELRDYSILALATLHNYSIIKFNKDYTLLGNVLGLFCKTAFAVSIGESRYCGDLKGVITLPGGRAACYNEMKTLSNNKFLNHLKTAYYSFKKCYYSGGYGGPAWFTCTDKIVDIYNFALQGNVDEAVSNFNDVIHLNHNGGFYLNKIISKDYFDDAAKNPSEFTIKNLHKILNILKTIHDFINSKLPYDKIESIDKEKILNFSSPKSLFNFLKDGQEEIIQENKQVKDFKSSFVSPPDTETSSISTTLNSSKIMAAFSLSKEIIVTKNANGTGNDGLFIKPLHKSWPSDKAIFINKHNLKNYPDIKDNEIIMLYNVPYYWSKTNYYYSQNSFFSKEFLKKFLTSKFLVDCYKFNLEEFQLTKPVIVSSINDISNIIAKENKAKNTTSISDEINQMSSENLNNLFNTITKLHDQWKASVVEKNLINSNVL